MSKMVYDFGVDIENSSSDERKVLIWPVAAWACYIPENMNPKINILEKLILSLAKLGITDFESILCKKLEFSEELISAAVAECQEKQYLDKRKKTILKAGREAIEGYENSYAADMEMSKSSKKIYMFQDLVTGNVIPLFDIEKLPNNYEDVDDYIMVERDMSHTNRPTTISINNALKQWRRICSYEMTGNSYGRSNIDSTKLEEDFVNLENEIDWQEIDENGEVKKEKVKTLFDVEQEENDKKKDISQLTIYDDRSEMYYAKAYLAINRNDPDEVLIMSPFGEKVNDWFRTVINRVRINDNKFEEEFQLFVEEKKIDLMDRFAFNNELNIELFKKHPMLCNSTSYQDTKKALEDVTKCKIRMENGEDETTHFGKDMRTAIDCIFREVIKKKKQILQLKSRVQNYRDYEKAIKDLVYIYSLNDNIRKKYCNIHIYNNMLTNSEKNGAAKDYAALILLDAYYNPKSESMLLLKDLPELFTMIFPLIQEGNNMNHAKLGFSQTTYTKGKIEEFYRQIEKIVTTIYTHYLGGEE